MRIPVALYPFSSKHLPVVKFFNKLQNRYTLSELISFPGNGLVGKDAGYSRAHPDVGLTVTDALFSERSAWDMLVFADVTSAQYEYAVNIEDIFERLLQADKILHYSSSYTNAPQRVQLLSEIYSKKVKFSEETILEASKYGISENEFSYLDKPVVLVGGLFEEADVFEVLLGLVDKLRDEGLTVTTVTKNSIGRMFGFHTLSHIIGRCDLSEAQKVHEINRFIKALELIERPDVVLLEAPDALKRFNDYAPNGFGIRTYMLCQAINPDYLVCCVPCDLAIGELVDRLSADFSNKFGSSIHAVHVSNVVIDSMNVMQEYALSHVHVDLQTVQKQINSQRAISKIPLFDVVGQGVDDLYTHMRSFLLS